MSEVFPPEWDSVEDKERVILLLISLEIGAREKKYALYEWCRLHDVELTGEDVRRVTGRPAGEI